MRRRVLRSAVGAFGLLVLIFLLFASVSRAQTVQGQINGTITDAGGNAVSGAVIMLKSLDTNNERTTLSASSGVYFLSSVQPGHYSLTVSSPGLKPTRFPSSSSA